MLKIDEPLRTPSSDGLLDRLRLESCIGRAVATTPREEKRKKRRLTYSEQEDTQDSKSLMHVKPSSLRTNFLPIYERSEKMHPNGAVHRENLP